MQISETYMYIFRNMQRCLRYYEACEDKTCSMCEGHLIRARWWGSRIAAESRCEGLKDDCPAG